MTSVITALYKYSKEIAASESESDDVTANTVEILKNLATLTLGQVSQRLDTVFVSVIDLAALNGHALPSCMVAEPQLHDL